MLIPVIKVYDKATKRTHIVGSDSHDSLYVNENGHIGYFNLQNGEGTLGDYEFVKYDNGYEDNHIELITIDEWLKIAGCEKAKEIERNKLMAEFIQKLKNEGGENL